MPIVIEDEVFSVDIKPLVIFQKSHLAGGRLYLQQLGEQSGAGDTGYPGESEHTELMSITATVQILVKHRIVYHTVSQKGYNTFP